MLRRDLLNDLNTIAPGLANKNLIPLLTHCWFTGTHVMTFNEQIAISAACKTDFIAAVPGDILIKLISTSKAREVELKKEENVLLIKMFKTKLKLNMLEMEGNFIFKMPSPESKYQICRSPTDKEIEEAKKEDKPLTDKTKVFLNAIKSCLRSTSTDTSAPERIGITLIPKGKTLKLFSTDNATLSNEMLMLDKEPKFSRVILSSIFCEQLIAIAASAEKVQVEIHDDFSLATFDNRVTLFGNLIQDADKPFDFQNILDNRIPTNYTNHIPIPSRMELALERALVITKSKIEEEIDSEFSIKDGFLTVYSKSKTYGDITDRIELEGDHPEVRIKVHCKYLKKDFPFFTRMFITKDCWIMLRPDKAGPGSTYLIAGS